MAWQGNGMGATWERHAMCESAFILPSLDRSNGWTTSEFKILLTAQARSGLRE